MLVSTGACSAFCPFSPTPLPPNNFCGDFHILHFPADPSATYNWNGFRNFEKSWHTEKFNCPGTSKALEVKSRLCWANLNQADLHTPELFATIFWLIISPCKVCWPSLKTIIPVLINGSRKSTDACQPRWRGFMMGELYEDLWLSGCFEAERINQHSQQRLHRDYTDAFYVTRDLPKGIDSGIRLNWSHCSDWWHILKKLKGLKSSFYVDLRRMDRDKHRDDRALQAIFQAGSSLTGECSWW